MFKHSSFYRVGFWHDIVAFTQFWERSFEILPMLICTSWHVYASMQPLLYLALLYNTLILILMYISTFNILYHLWSLGTLCLLILLGLLILLNRWVMWVVWSFGSFGSFRCFGSFVSFESFESFGPLGSFESLILSSPSSLLVFWVF